MTQDEQLDKDILDMQDSLEALNKLLSPDNPKFASLPEGQKAVAVDYKNYLVNMIASMTEKKDAVKE